MCFVRILILYFSLRGLETNIHENYETKNNITKTRGTRDFRIKSTTEVYQIGHRVKRGHIFQIGHRVKRGLTIQMGPWVKRGLTIQIGQWVKGGLTIQMGHWVKRWDIG